MWFSSGAFLETKTVLPILTQGECENPLKSHSNVLISIVLPSGELRPPQPEPAGELRTAAQSK